MRTRLRRIAVMAAALLTATTALPEATAQGSAPQGHPSHGGLSAVIRYTEYGIPHIVAKDYANLGFGNAAGLRRDGLTVLRHAHAHAQSMNLPTGHPVRVDIADNLRITERNAGG